MRGFWRRLGTPDAISWLSYVVIWVSMSTGPFMSAGVDYRSRVPLFTAIVLTSLAATTPPLVIGKWLLRRFTGAAWAPVFTLVVFQLAVLFRSWAFDSLLVTFNFAPRPLLLWRWAATQMTIMVGLLIVAYVVPAARELSATNVTLEAQVKHLAELRTQMQTRIAEHRTRLVNSIRTELDRALSRLNANSNEATSLALQNTIDDVVRPISLQLRAGGDRATEREPVVVVQRIQWGLVVQLSMGRSPFHPVLLSAWVTAAAFGSWLPRFGSQTLIIVLGGGLATALTLTLASLGWRRLPQGVRTGWRSVLFTLALIVSAFMCVFGASLFGDNVLEPATFVAAAWNVSTFGWAMALAAGVPASLRQTQCELEQLETELAREVTTLNAESRQSQLALSRLLHGPVQDAIASTLRKVVTGIDVTQLPELVGSLQQTITNALESEDFSVRTVSFRAALADVAELWDGLCEISVVAADADLAKVELDPIATSALIELAREACSNAVRHADAESCVIEVALSGDGRSVELVVTNNGAALSADAVGGYGSQLFSELSTSWGRETTTDGTRVSATIPFAVAPESGRTP